MIERHGLAYPTWGEGSSAGRDRRLAKHDLEQRVSDFIRALPVLWIDVDDEPGPDSDRAFVERNAIGLVSNYREEPLDPRDDRWLGTDSPSEAIREPGLWNVDHADEGYDPAFLDRFEAAVRLTPESEGRS